jgi:hypothetical protein
VLCAAIAVAGACTALAAPWLGPRIGARATHWLGEGNAISAVLSPRPAVTPPAPAPVSTDAAQPPAVSVETVAAEAARIGQDAMRASLASFDARIADSIKELRDEAARLEAGRQTALASMVADATKAGQDALRADVAASTAGIAGLDARIAQLQTTATALDARIRSANVLALANGLRRNVDAGVPIDHICAALAATGPFPAPIDDALKTVSHYAAGVPTMRDLSDSFEPVNARMAERFGTPWVLRSWARVKTLFGAPAPTGNDAVLDHVRALVAVGRFSEAAKVLDASDLAPLAADWGTMVRARAAAVGATQVIIEYALTVTEAAYANDAGTGGGAASR